MPPGLKDSLRPFPEILDNLGLHHDLPGDDTEDLTGEPPEAQSPEDFIKLYSDDDPSLHEVHTTKGTVETTQRQTRRGKPSSGAQWPTWTDNPVKQVHREWIAMNAWIDWLLGLRPHASRWPYREFGSKRARAASAFARSLEFRTPGVPI